jgi:hypothetical protein
MAEEDNGSRKTRELVPVPAEEAEKKPDYRGPARFPFLDRFNLKRVKAFKSLVDEETSLAESLIGHQKAVDRLRGIHVEIEAERIERENRLREVKRTQKFQDKHDELEELRLDVEKTRLLKEKQEFEQSQKDKTPLEAHEEKNRLRAEKARLDRSIRRHEALSKVREDVEFYRDLEEKKEKEKIKTIAVFMKGRRFSDLSEDEQAALDRQLEDIEDRFDQIKDRAD